MRVFAIKTHHPIHHSQPAGHAHRSKAKRLGDVAKAILNISHYYWHKTSLRAKYTFVKRNPAYLHPRLNHGKYEYDLKQLPWNQANAHPSQGLYLFVHGLRGTPLNWSKYIHYLKKNVPNAYVVAPYVPYRGNCSLADASDPLISIVNDHLKKFPTAGIYGVGISNGSRVFSKIEVELDPKLMQQSSLTVVSIAGVHEGTKVINRAQKAKLLWAARLHPAIAKDFKWKSPSSQELLQQLRDKQIVWKNGKIPVRHLFYATTEDEQVRPITSSLPQLPFTPPENYKTMHGEGHLNIVHAARKEVVQWLQKKG